MESHIDALCSQCQDERLTFRHGGHVVHDKRSSGCNALLRLALEGDSDALQHAQRIFEPFLQRWVTARSVLLSDIDPDDIGHDAWVDFCIGAPKDADELLANEQIGRAINYMIRCARNRILMHQRKARVSVDSNEDIERLPIAGPDSGNFVDEVRACIRRVLPSDKEIIIAEERLMEGRTSQTIAAAHPKEFADVHEVHRTTERVRAKLKRDPELRELASRGVVGGILVMAALLPSEAEMSDSEQAMSKRTCQISDSDLLDYINGVADAHLVAQVEASADCIEATRRLRNELAVLQPILRTAFCPGTMQLVEYHVAVLQGIQRLRIWKHVKQCPHCQADLRLLEQLDRTPESLGEIVGQAVKRIVEAVFIRPEMRVHAVRGETLEYSVDDLRILIQIDPETTKPPRWHLMARLRASQRDVSSRKRVQLERVLVVPAGTKDDVPSVLTQITTGTAQFEVEALPAGFYDLLITTADLDVVVENVPVGHLP